MSFSSRDSIFLKLFCILRSFIRSVINSKTSCSLLSLITNFIFHEDIVKIFPKLIKKKGILNIGGQTKSVYKFAKNFNKGVKGIKARKYLGKNIPLNHSMNLKKLKEIIND